MVIKLNIETGSFQYLQIKLMLDVPDILICLLVQLWANNMSLNVNNFLLPVFLQNIIIDAIIYTIILKTNPIGPLVLPEVHVSCIFIYSGSEYDIN